MRLSFFKKTKCCFTWGATKTTLHLLLQLIMITMFGVLFLHTQIDFDDSFVFQKNLEVEKQMIIGAN
jgi:hypothetical protein